MLELPKSRSAALETFLNSKPAVFIHPRHLRWEVDVQERGLLGVQVLPPEPLGIRPGNEPRIERDAELQDLPGEEGPGVRGVRLHAGGLLGVLSEHGVHHVEVRSLGIQDLAEDLIRHERPHDVHDLVECVRPVEGHERGYRHVGRDPGVAGLVEHLDAAGWRRGARLERAGEDVIEVR